MTIVEHPKEILTGGVLQSGGAEGSRSLVFHERDTSLSPSGVFHYENHMWRMGNSIVLPGGSQIWEYNMTHANKTLPSKFNHVGNNKDRCKKWHFTLDNLTEVPTIVPRMYIVRPPPAVSTVRASKSNIPTHVFHAFVEAAIGKREECPITMEALTKENVACPPCGHLFEKEGLRRALESSGKCPTCRGEATVNDIQTW
jgi:predicted Zn-ribbon and HTH transcriptional regulator